VTIRDRLVVASLVALLAIGGMWLALVSPERGRVSSLSKQVTSERSSLVQAQSTLAQARAAAAAYVPNVRQMRQAVHAVPTSPGEAQLIKTIVRLAGTKVDFKQLSVGASSPGSGPTALSLSFNFNANYGNLQSFLSGIDALTTTSGSRLYAHGRLFTIETVSLQPGPNNTTNASIIADVYQQQLLSGATGATGTVAP
jgi:hypothetical protein